MSILKGKNIVLSACIAFTPKFRVVTPDVKDQSLAFRQRQGQTDGATRTMLVKLNDNKFYYLKQVYKSVKSKNGNARPGGWHSTSLTDAPRDVKFPKSKFSLKKKKEKDIFKGDDFLKDILG